ncbi:kinase-like protein [Aspergillus sclerotioniger CBS 115572]|uniref:Serine/threonine-protein kinase ATG1 n=1 Tax=Aspergillus sclerotioniger CBS 115572 TaxID=1450535 RepID=A0A317XFB8_9EURO|nr:kinase-like protein [Aspergillus sclerotioniger CBS 115572]PWY96512.1 kinase-like protein [Aspergillus sclerotioniger CBS 115572]
MPSDHPSSLFLNNSTNQLEDRLQGLNLPSSESNSSQSRHYEALNLMEDQPTSELPAPEVKDFKKNYKSRKCIFRCRGKVLGKGSYGRTRIVYKRQSDDKNPYVVKEFFKHAGISKKKRNEIIDKEYTLTRCARHPNVINVIDLCIRKDNLSYVMEYCNQGDLWDILEKRRYPVKDQLCLFKQLLRGVANLHSQGIAHLDIKPGNLLLGNDSVLRLTDFGFSDIFRDPKTHQVLLCPPDNSGPGTAGYAPPEVFRHADYDPFKVDVWSCAMVALEITRRVPFPWEMPVETDQDYLAFVKGWREFMRANPNGVITEHCYPRCGPISDPRHYPNIQLMVLILKMLNPHPGHRISIHKALRDPFVRNIECCSPAYIRNAPPLHPPTIKHDHRACPALPAPPRSIMGRRGRT